MKFLVKVGVLVTEHTIGKFFYNNVGHSYSNTTYIQTPLYCKRALQ